MAENEETWETQEVIDWLINDESAYLETLGMSASQLKTFVVTARRAPAGLYESFAQPPRSSWRSVDWNAVAQACKKE